jgi:cytochrome c biogenesis protein CcmG/thiol:disulfide interchange protein DsbE
MKRTYVILPLVAFVIVVGVFAWLLLFAEDGARDASTIPSALIGQPVPQFDLPAVHPSLPGGFSAADLKGEPAIVNVFASWCVPCLAEHPLIAALAQQGWRVYGLNHKDKPEDARRWLETHGNPYAAVGADTDGRASIEWGVTGVPETFIVDAEGVIRFKWAGPLTPELVTTRLQPVLDAVKK